MHGNADILGLTGVAQGHAGYHSIFVHRGLGPSLGSSTHAPWGPSSQRHLGPASAAAHLSAIDFLCMIGLVVLVLPERRLPFLAGVGVWMCLKGVFSFWPPLTRSAGADEKTKGTGRCAS